MFLTTPESHDFLALNPEGSGGYPGGYAVEVAREHWLGGIQGDASHFDIMLEGHKDYNAAISAAPNFGGRLVSPYEHGGLVAHASIADPDGYMIEIQYGGADLPVTES